ncbi:amidohydrolase family-domain-containing protein [Mycena vitilis]|nr:amidohydrolase family-domain-containing protein [Mycena vitilis]
MSGLKALPQAQLSNPNPSVHTRVNGTCKALASVALVGSVLVACLSRFYFTLSTRTGSYALCSAKGNIYTVDLNNTRAECILVKDSKILTTGTIAAIGQQVPNVVYVPDDAIVVPGLSDSHGHLLEYGASRRLPLEGATSLNETVARVREHILRTPAVLHDLHAVVRGGGWDHTRWPDAAWPTADALDADPVIRGRPVVLQSKDCHALWVSQRVLQLSAPFITGGIEGGAILRGNSSAPTGVFLDNAQALLKLPDLTEEDLVQQFTTAVTDALAYGLTSVHDAGLDPASLDLFLRRMSIPMRIYAMRFFDEKAPYWGNTTKPLVGAVNGRLTARSVKIFADGALRTGGSALHEPYADNPSTSGFMRLEPRVLFEFIPRFLRDGWQVNVHAIGDRANGIVLDAFEAALDGVNVTTLRPRLEHAQLMRKEDMERLGRLGVIASVQPTHAISDMWFAQERLVRHVELNVSNPRARCLTNQSLTQGPGRVKGLYAFRSLLRSGARITLGSDFPVETMNPLTGFYAAITRLSTRGESPHGAGGWFPEERLTREEALRGMTIDPAYASFTESILGSLEPGKRADFTVLSHDIMRIPAEEILGVVVRATVIDGEIVHGAL